MWKGADYEREGCQGHGAILSKGGTKRAGTRLRTWKVEQYKRKCRPGLSEEL